MVTIGIFAKPPHPGVVKTRLIPDIGATAAATVYRRCLQHALDTARASKLDLRLFLSAPCEDDLFHGFGINIQHGANLGEKMFNAIKDLIDDGSSGAIILGSDCLDLEVQHLHQAAHALCDHDLVLLPAVDGGYALIGCNRIDPELFAGIRWSSAQVMAQTLVNADRLNYRVCQFETVRDIDTLQDLERYPELTRLISRK